MAKLKFKLDANEKPLKIGIGMYSKEDEYVDFDKDCDCSGQVGGSNFQFNLCHGRWCVFLANSYMGGENRYTVERHPVENYYYHFPREQKCVIKH